MEKEIISLNKGEGVTTSYAKVAIKDVGFKAVVNGRVMTVKEELLSGMLGVVSGGKVNTRSNMYLEINRYDHGDVKLCIKELLSQNILFESTSSQNFLHEALGCQCGIMLKDVSDMSYDDVLNRIYELEDKGELDNYYATILYLFNNHYGAIDYHENELDLITSRVRSRFYEQKK